MSSVVTPADYWRGSKQWRKWLGRRGTVIASTVIRVSSSAFENVTPYPFLLIDFGDVKLELIGSDKKQFLPGDTVVCVLRKMQDGASDGIVSYGIKVVLEKESKQFA